MREPKVYRLITFLVGVRNVQGKIERQVEAVVAAPSRRAAAAAFAVSEGEIAKYGTVTGNAVDVATAMSEPGTAFWRPLDDRGPYRRYTPPEKE